MYQEQQPGPGFEDDASGRIFDVIHSVYELRQNCELAVHTYIENDERENTEEITQVYEAAARSIDIALYNILSSDDIALAERASLAANVLMVDEMMRIKFFREMCSVNDPEIFNSGYSSEQAIKQDILEQLGSVKDTNACVDVLSEKHVGFINTDIYGLVACLFPEDDGGFYDQSMN